MKATGPHAKQSQQETPNQTVKPIVTVALEAAANNQGIVFHHDEGGKGVAPTKTVSLVGDVARRVAIHPSAKLEENEDNACQGSNETTCLIAKGYTGSID